MKLIVYLIAGVLVSAPHYMMAQDQPAANTGTNYFPLLNSPEYLNSVNQEKKVGERCLFPPGLKVLMRLTNAQKRDLKPLEDEFAKTAEQYRVANRVAIDGALVAERDARMAKDQALIEAARKRLQDAWSGLQSARADFVFRARAFLTPDQLVILDDPNNQWRESYPVEADDPSANELP